MSRQCIVAIVLTVLLCSTLPSAAAEEPTTSVEANDATEIAPSTAAENTLARIKKAQKALEDKKTQADQTPEATSLATPVVKNSMYFFGFLLLCISILKRVTTNKRSDALPERIEVLERKNLSNRSSLLVVRVAEESFLLSQSGDEVSFLTALQESPRFSDHLSHPSEQSAQLNSVANVAVVK